MGIYIDSDGDLAQDEEHIINPDDPDPSPTPGTVPDDQVATDDEVDEMIDDVFD